MLNHLEALDHCPTTRTGLRERLEREGLLAKVRIPDDGETLSFVREGRDAHARPSAYASQKPGLRT